MHLKQNRKRSFIIVNEENPGKTVKTATQDLGALFWI